MSIIQSIFTYLTRQADIEHRRAILSLLEQDENARLLDLGCGDGEFTLKVAERIGTKQIYGVDIVEKRIAEAKARGIEIYRCDLNDTLPIESENFDVVLGNQIIEHLANTDVFVREIHRVLRTGGYAVITTPNLAAIHNILFLLLGKQPPTASVSDEFLVGTWYPGEKSLDPVEKQPSHQRIFTLAALKELLEYHGFQIERSIGSEYFPLSTPLAKVMCYIDKRHATHITVKARKSENLSGV